MSEQAPWVYDLTQMTKHADKDRSLVIGTIEMSKRMWVIVVLGLVAGIFGTAILAPFLGVNSVFVIPLFILAAWFLFEARSSRGMKLRNWETLLDKQKNRNGRFFVCGHEVHVGKSNIVILRSLTTPVTRDGVGDDSIFQKDNA